uniref:Uncharacterized protein n=1 Tax=Setaria viridis TaxID=4556 RepID=A0A4U6UW95_SETVI|nr:hypothetical protein SEVIR_4G117600v2 [Setaria viridis]
MTKRDEGMGGLSSQRCHTDSIVATRVGATTSAATADSVVTARTGATVSATAADSVVTAGVGATVFVVAAGAGATVSVTTTVPTAAAAASMTDALDVDASPTGSSFASSSRFITSPDGGTPGAAPCPAGSAAGAKGGPGVGPGSVPDCGTLSLAAASCLRGGHRGLSNDTTARSQRGHGRGSGVDSVDPLGAPRADP